MAMTFNKPVQQPQAEAPAQAPAGDIIEVKPYDIAADRDATTKALAHSPEVEALTAAIDINDLNTIVSFGAQSAEEISKASDLVLRSMSMSQIDETSKMLNTLGKIMDQFDINEIKENPSLFNKLFGNMKKQLDKILAKYHTMGDEVDKILGLELGADDYIVKPFSVRELIARVKALLRRAAPQNEEEGILHVGGLTIDVGNYEAFRNGEKLSLTLKEFELLKLLVLSRGKVLTRDFLLDRIWGYEFYGETRTVDVHIRHIRQKLGDDAHYIETIRGVGYKFNDRQENRL